MANEYSAKFGTARFGKSYFNMMVKDILVDTLLKAPSQKISQNIDTYLRQDEVFKYNYIDTVLNYDRNKINQLLDTLLQESEVVRQYVLDTILESSDVKTYLTDSLLEGLKDMNMDIDTLLEKMYIDKYELFDTLLSKIKDSEYSLDAVIEGLRSQSALFDAYILSIEEGIDTIYLDTILKGIKESQVSIDTFISVGDVPKILFFDTFVSMAKSSNVRFDVLLKVLKQNSVNFDSILKIILQSDFSMDTLLEIIISKQNLFDILSERLNVPSSFLLDSYTKSESSKIENPLDTILGQLGTEKEIIVDTILKLLEKRQLDLDMLLSKLDIKDRFIIDSILEMSDNKLSTLVDTYLNFVRLNMYKIDSYLTGDKSKASYIDSYITSFYTEISSPLDFILFKYVFIDTANVTNSSLFTLDVNTYSLFFMDTTGPTPIYVPSITYEAAD